MASPIMKFRNMGASCFVNAGLQAVFALPGFESLRATTATERALIENRRLAVQPRMPSFRNLCLISTINVVKKIVVNSWWSSCRIVRPCTASCEARKKRSCLHRMRVSPRVANRALLVHASGPCRRDRLLQSVQTAVNTYLEQQPLQEDVLHWECVTDTCLASGTARQAPRRLTTMEEWPENLVVTLKRWDGLRGLLSHKAHVDAELRVEQGNIVYRLRSVVSHIGETAASGHYVAYRPRESDFLRFDDSTVSTTKQNPGTETLAAGEKVYIVCYNRVAEVPVIPVVPAKRDAIHLDGSDESEDSDVIVASTTPLPVSGQQAVNQSGRYTTEHPVEPMAKRAKTEDSQETLPQETSRKQFGNYANYSEEERDTILKALQTSEWFADAVKSLKKKMVHFTLTKRKLQYRLHRNTLMNWFSTARAWAPGPTTADFYSCRNCFHSQAILEQ